MLEVAHKGWGWSSVIRRPRLSEAALRRAVSFSLELEGDVSRSLAPAVVPLRPFCGVMGVAPAETGEFRTRPPGVFGGNMDVRELCSGATLYLPVLNRGALFSAGDAHAAQGDGEVCINGIECPSDVTLRFQIALRGSHWRAPLIESPAARERNSRKASAWIVVESWSRRRRRRARGHVAHDRSAGGTLGHSSDVHAYLLCSVAMNLRLSQVVNEPMFTVSAAIPKGVLPARELF